MHLKKTNLFILCFHFFFFYHQSNAKFTIPNKDEEKGKKITFINFGHVCIYINICSMSYNQSLLFSNFNLILFSSNMHSIIGWSM